MSHYTLEDLIARWKREELSVEQMIGQFALVLAAQEQRLRALERRVPEEPVAVPMAPPPKVEPKRR
jgi:hypothetical protein